MAAPGGDGSWTVCRRSQGFCLQWRNGLRLSSWHRCWISECSWLWEGSSMSELKCFMTCSASMIVRVFHILRPFSFNVVAATGWRVPALWQSQVQVELLQLQNWPTLYPCFSSHFRCFADRCSASLASECFYQRQITLKPYRKPIVAVVAACSVVAVAVADTVSWVCST